MPGNEATLTRTHSQTFEVKRNQQYSFTNRAIDRDRSLRARIRAQNEKFASAPHARAYRDASAAIIYVYAYAQYSQRTSVYAHSLRRAVCVHDLLSQAWRLKDSEKCKSFVLELPQPIQQATCSWELEYAKGYRSKFRARVSERLRQASSEIKYAKGHSTFSANAAITLFQV